MENPNLKTALAKTKYTFKELPGKAGALTHSINSPNKIIPLTKANYKIIASKTGSTDEAGVVTVMLIEVIQRRVSNDVTRRDSVESKKQYTVITMGSKDSKNQEANKISKWISTGDVKISSN